MRKDLALRLGEANAIDDAGVVQRVTDDRRSLRRQDGDDSRVAGEAGLEGQHRLDVLEGRQARLQLLVEAHGPGDGSDRAGSGSISLDSLDRRLAQPGMRVEAQVVVRGERDHLATVDHASAALLALHDTQPPIQAFGLQLIDLALQEGERVARAGCGRARGRGDGIGHGMSTTFPA